MIILGFFVNKLSKIHNAITVAHPGLARIWEDYFGIMHEHFSAILSSFLRSYENYMFKI